MRGCIVNRPSCPSLEGGSLILNQAFPLTIKGKDVTALRCSEPLRYKVGGASKPSPCCAGWDRLVKVGDSMEWACYNGVIDY